MTKANTIMSMCKRLWNDQRGAVSSIELVLVATIIVIGTIVGLATYRDAIVQELGDSAAAMSELNQGYEVDGISMSRNYVLANNEVITARAEVPGMQYSDERDACQPPVTDRTGRAPMCIALTVPPDDEDT